MTICREVLAITWISWGDWLGTDAVATHLREYRSFADARSFARNLSIRSQREWYKYAKAGLLPADISPNPNQVYAKDGWISWGDWLGTGFVHRRLRHYRPFTEARDFARSLGLKSTAEWYDRVKGGLPIDTPASPEHVYAKQGRISWGDWLGTGAIAARLRPYRSFPEAREFARSLGLKSVAEWWARTSQLPEDIPASPQKVYVGQGWDNWMDWLGSNASRRKTGLREPLKRVGRT